jgi:hypothetical protein
MRIQRGTETAEQAKKREQQARGNRERIARDRILRDRVGG